MIRWSIVTTCRRYSSSLLHVSPSARLDAKCLTVKESFITPLEQSSLMEEIESSLGRARYCYDHWDDVSVDYCISRAIV